MNSNLNPLFEGGISWQVPRRDDDLPPSEGRNGIDKVVDLISTGHLSPRKVAAVHLKRLRRKNPKRAKEFFRFANDPRNQKYNYSFRRHVISDVLPNSQAGHDASTSLFSFLN